MVDDVKKPRKGQTKVTEKATVEVEDEQTIIEYSINAVTPLSRTTHKIVEQEKELKERLYNTGRWIMETYPDAVISKIQAVIPSESGAKNIISIDNANIPIRKNILVIGHGDYKTFSRLLSRAATTKEDLSLRKEKAMWDLMYSSLGLRCAFQNTAQYAKKHKMGFGEAEKTQETTLVDMINLFSENLPEFAKGKELRQKAINLLSDNYFFANHPEYLNEAKVRDIVRQTVLYIAGEDLIRYGKKGKKQKAVKKLSKIMVDSGPEKIEFSTIRKSKLKKLLNIISSYNPFHLENSDIPNKEEYKKVIEGLREDLNTAQDKYKILLVPRLDEALYYKKNLEQYLKEHDIAKRVEIIQIETAKEYEL